MKCEKCQGNTKVVDTREKNHSKSALQVRLKLPRIFESAYPYRWRKRQCIECNHSTYTIEIEIEHLRKINESNSSTESS